MDADSKDKQGNEIVNESDPTEQRKGTGADACADGDDDLSKKETLSPPSAQHGRHVLAEHETSSILDGSLFQPPN